MFLIANEAPELYFNVDSIWLHKTNYGGTFKHSRGLYDKFFERSRKI